MHGARLRKLSNAQQISMDIIIDKIMNSHVFVTYSEIEDGTPRQR